jgi:NAD+ synthase (glutamine-hydrolysing)
MNRIRIALAQLNPTVGDLKGNRSLVAGAIDEARAAGADLVAAPELVITGYPPEDLVLKPSFVRDNVSVLDDLAQETFGITAIVGFIQPDGDDVYNAAAVIADGEVKGVYRKHLLPNYGVFDEKRYFVPGDRIELLRLNGALIGVTICEDLWSSEGPHVRCARAGAELIVNVNASPYHRGKGRQRAALLAERARETGAAFAYVNMVGGQDELVFDGQSSIVAASGEVLARASQFSEELLVFDYEPRGEDGGPAEAIELTPRSEARPPVEARIAPEMGDAEEVYTALVAGVRDYLGKNGFQAAVVGLSGGIDSALTAAVAVDALGAGSVLGVLMPTDYTAQESLDYALDLAERLGMDAITLPISGLFGSFLDTLDPVFAGTEPGLAEENLQARIRGTLLMAISNKTGRIVLSTGNKSEMAVGYATLYGDMAGGFAVLKDVPKTLVYELCEWRNGSGEVIPRTIIERPPTAELRPDQLDTDSLPPYEHLDPMLKLYVEDYEGLDAITGSDVDHKVARRVVGMVDAAEYKRRQAAPGVKVTERAFGRDRRLPITNRYRPEQ